MVFFVKKLILLGLITILPSCAIIDAYKEKLKTPEKISESKLPYHHSSSDFKLAWDTVQTGDDTVISGVITNVHKIPVMDIYLLVEMLDLDGTKLSSGDVVLSDVNLQMNESSAFSVKLKNTTIAEGNVLNIIINYRISSGAWGGSNRYISFKVDATTGRAIEEQKGK